MSVGRKHCFELLMFRSFSRMAHTYQEMGGKLQTEPYSKVEAHTHRNTHKDIHTFMYMYIQRHRNTHTDMMETDRDGL